MDAIVKGTKPNKRTIQINRARLFVQTPKERKDNLDQDGGFEGEAS